jgi:uncharacterized protein (DUF2336 family)
MLTNYRKNKTIVKRSDLNPATTTILLEDGDLHQTKLPLEEKSGVTRCTSGKQAFYPGG